MPRHPRTTLAVDEALVERLTTFLREHTTTTGRKVYRGSIDNLLWNLAERFPEHPRPRVGELACVLDYLADKRRLQSYIGLDGARRYRLTEGGHNEQAKAGV